MYANISERYLTKRWKDIAYIILCLQRTQMVVKPADEEAAADGAPPPPLDEEGHLREQPNGLNHRRVCNTIFTLYH